MNTENNYIQQIREQLIQLKPHLILLFGSYAYGKPQTDSDIDLLVVTNDNFIPQSFREKHELYRLVNEKLRPIKAHIAVDLIVHTIPMHQTFIAQNSSFAQEILTKGKILYESNHSRMD